MDDKKYVEELIEKDSEYVKNSRNIILHIQQKIEEEIKRQDYEAVEILVDLLKKCLVLNKKIETMDFLMS